MGASSDVVLPMPPRAARVHGRAPSGRSGKPICFLLDSFRSRRALLRCVVTSPHPARPTSGGGARDAPAGEFRVKRGHSFGLHKHDRCGCFDLRRNCCFVCRYNGTDRAGLDPKAQLARKPERPALHRCQCGAARECWNCNRSRVANRNGAWLFQIVHMKLAVSAKAPGRPPWSAVEYAPLTLGSGPD
jgi:hypothetical protein